MEVVGHDSTHSPSPPVVKLASSHKLALQLWAKVGTIKIEVHMYGKLLHLVPHQSPKHSLHEVHAKMGEFASTLIGQLPHMKAPGKFMEIEVVPPNRSLR